MARWTCLGKRFIDLEYKMVWYAVYFRIFFPERNDCKRILNLNIPPQSNFVIIRNTFPDWLLLCTCLRNEKQEKRCLNVPNQYKTKEFLVLHKNGEFEDYRWFLCLLHEVLCFKSKYRAQTISLIWIPFLSLRISLLLFLQFYRRGWERSMGYVTELRTKSVKRCKMHSILRNCRNGFLRGWDLASWDLELVPRLLSVTTISLSNSPHADLQLPKMYLVCPHPKKKK